MLSFENGTVEPFSGQQRSFSIELICGPNMASPAFIDMQPNLMHYKFVWSREEICT